MYTTNREHSSDSALDSSATTIRPDQQTAPQHNVKPKPTIVGLYGLPGSGKSYLRKELEQSVGKNDFLFYEGSKENGNLVPDGLENSRKQGMKRRTSGVSKPLRGFATNARRTTKLALSRDTSCSGPKARMLEMQCTPKRI